MTIEEIRNYRSLTTGGYPIDGLHEVTINGIKKYREQHKPKSWSEVFSEQHQSHIFGGCWSSSFIRYDDPLSPIYGRVWGGSLKAHSQ
jgi:hypothetical protein